MPLTKVTSSLINTVSASQIVATGATAGQVLTYNGSTSTWVASAAPGASGLSGGVNAIVFSGAVAAATTYSGTFSRGASNTTITINNHGLLTDHRVYLTFSGTVTNSNYVITVLDTNTFTITAAGGAATGTASFKMCSVTTKTSGFVGMNYWTAGTYAALLSQNIATSSAISLLPSNRNSSGGTIDLTYKYIDYTPTGLVVARTANSFVFGYETSGAVPNDAGQYSSVIIVTP